jgi:serine phosphatase RsbU (regulator of sigma subunit)
MGIVYANNYLGDLFNDSKNYVEAKTHLEIALAIAEKMNVKPQLKDTYRSLSNTYRGLNDYKKADEYFQLFSQTKDSLLNESTSKQITEMQTKYETETKEKEILLLNTDKKLKDTELAQRRIVEYFLTGVGVLILLLALMLFKANQNKQKANELLTQQKQEISTQRDLIEEQKNVVVHQKKEITDSINYAQRIQHAIHAPIAEIKTHLPDSFVYYKPKDIVSGDFYWFDCKDDICYIAAADCTGHGIPGALMTMLGTLLINEITNSKKILEPSRILKNLNYLLNITFRQDKILDGMDIALCALNTKTNELKYAGANRPLWIIKRTENTTSSPTNTAFQLEELKADKTAIGGYTELDHEFTTNTCQLKKGDSFYIFSDGYIDQFGGEKGKKLTTKRFREKILSLQNESMQEQETHLDEYITSWRNTLEQVDDLLVIGVRV